MSSAFIQPARSVCVASGCFFIIIIIIIACQHAYACRSRYCFTSSVCLSVCTMTVLCQNECLTCHSFSTFWHEHHSSFFSTPSPLQHSKRHPISRGVNYRWWENCTLIAIYLGNSWPIDPRTVHNYKWTIDFHGTSQIETKNLHNAMPQLAARDVKRNNGMI